MKKLPTGQLKELPDKVADMVNAELDDGEELLWIGQPVVWRHSLSYLPPSLFGAAFVLIGAFFLFMQMPDFDDWADVFGLICAAPPFLIGAALIVIPPMYLAFKAKNTVYVLTRYRAIVIEGGFSWSIRSIEPARLTDFQRKQNSDGSGSLIFDHKFMTDKQVNYPQMPVGFHNIADVKAVEDIVKVIVKADETGAF